MKKIPFSLVLVEWKDHVSDSGGWLDSHDIVNRPALCLTVGWLFRQDEEGLTLVSCVDPVNPKEGQVGGTQYILKNCIVSMKVLRK